MILSASVRPYKTPPNSSKSLEFAPTQVGVRCASHPRGKSVRPYKPLRIKQIRESSPPTAGGWL